MRPIFCLLLCVACSEESQFVPRQSTGALTQIVAIDASSGSRRVPIMPTGTGDRVFTLLTGTDAFVHEIVAGTSRLGPLMTLSVGTCDQQWVWGWISSGVDAGIDSLLINADVGAPYAGYALIFSGLSPDIHLAFGETQDFAGGSNGDAIAPPLPTALGDVVVSSVATCGVVLPELSSSTFVGMPPINGAAVAYEIADGADQPAATWSLHDQRWQTYSLVLY